MHLTSLVVLTIIFIRAPHSLGFDLIFNSNVSRFSLELLYETLQDRNWDVVISPYGIWSLLISIAYETVGFTREEILKVLFLTDDRNKAVEGYKDLKQSVIVDRRTHMVRVTLLNFLFYDENFLVHSDCVTQLENNFGLITQRLNFTDSKKAAASASQTLQANRVITNILRNEDFDNSTMLMSNYLSFQATWSYPFIVLDTPHSSEPKLMQLKAFLRFSNLDSLHASITELPYRRDGKFCMLLIRPHSGFDIKEVYKSILLRENSTNEILAKLKREVDEYGLREVEVNLPEFTMTSLVVLNNPLSHMGLSSAFDKKLANFDNFAEEKIYISEIVHTTTIVVTSQGTTVVSNTPAYGAEKLLESSERVMNNPFIFLVLEKSTGTVLCGGCFSQTYNL